MYKRFFLTVVLRAKHSFSYIYLINNFPHGLLRANETTEGLSLCSRGSSENQPSFNDGTV